VRIKKDFVTNSSSSSFIVAFDKPVMSLDDIKDKIMFIEKAQTVFGDIQKQTPIKLELSEECISKLTDEISSGYFEGFIWEWDDLKNLKKSDFPTEREYFDTRMKIAGKYQAKNREKAEKIAIAFVEGNRRKVAYIFSYSDNDGKYMSEMEHGGTFDEFPHLTISHH
jgi:hypothetical protein